MAVTDSDLEGFELVSEKKPEKAGGVTISTIPAMLVKLLESEAPKALADKDYELILRMPVRVDLSDIAEVTEESTDKEKAQYEQAVAKAKDEANKKAISTLKQLTLYAAAWGKGQEPKLYIHKVPNRKDMPETTARLAVDKWEDVPADNRPGRRAGR